MTTHEIPYQCLQRSGDVLVAARGSLVDTFSLINGSYLSTWSSAPKSNLVLTNASEAASGSPPAKRRKVSIDGDNTTELASNGINKSANQQAGKQTKQPYKSRAECASTGLENPAVVCTATSEDGQYVVLVTAEDKSVRVLEKVLKHDGERTLEEISIRYGELQRRLLYC